MHAELLAFGQHLPEPLAHARADAEAEQPAASSGRGPAAGIVGESVVPEYGVLELLAVRIPVCQDAHRPEFRCKAFGRAGSQADKNDLAAHVLAGVVRQPVASADIDYLGIQTA